ncbi:hypothetical protein [uncultured Algibacter sp.]|uniref:hypothetical protein n=1 Tax=uncultured Algibacter sp. TaxID=298659 RepID=UPI00261B0DD6|nr:hypothetical protein [uncultured Algibacter sp.]
MKKIKYIIFLIAIVGTVISCDDTDVSSVISEDAKPVVSATISSSSLSESDSPTVNIMITMDKPIKTTTTFIANQVGGNASEADFVVGSAVVPAFQTSTILEVAINDDILPEGTETLELQITPAGVPDIYEVLETPVVSLSITNSTSDDFVFNMDWDALYLDADGGEHHLCDYDFDIEIYNADFSGPIAASYSDCPEEIRLSPGDLPDGNYWLAPTFWTNTTAVPPADPIDVPVILTFAKPGLSLDTVDLTGLWNTEVGGVVQGNPDSTLFKYILTISGSTYTVTDSDTGTVVFQG